MSFDLTNTYGHTPLHVSAKCGNLEAAKTLVEGGAAFNKGKENTARCRSRLNKKPNINISLRHTKAADINISNL